jgi:chemotaxis protein methyltransferase CheR
MDDHQFRQLLQQLGLCWTGYRKVKKGIKKRIRRHMRQLGHQDIVVYLAELDKSEERRQACERLMTVSISRFFRDRRLWQVLQQEVLPELIEKEREKIGIWSAGCASGEEVYSLKIVWDRVKLKRSHVPTLEILGTDLNPNHLHRARTGIYPPSSLKEVPLEVRSRYFFTRGEGSTYEVRPSLREDIVWKIHNLLSHPPGSDFHLIFLRNNLLTYYQDQIKKTAFGKVIESLKASGFLIIGSNESLPFDTSDLAPAGSFPGIFKKQDETFSRSNSLAL